MREFKCIIINCIIIVCTLRCCIKCTRKDSKNCAGYNVFIFISGISKFDVFINSLFIDRLGRILAMVYVVQSYWACFGLHPSSSTYKTMDKVQNKPNSSVQFIYYMLSKQMKICYAAVYEWKILEFDFGNKSIYYVSLNRWNVILSCLFIVFIAKSSHSCFSNI
jgi:hypothetical protein